MTYEEFKIPKKSGGFRKITAPDKELLKYQRSKLPTLEVLWNDISSEYGVDNVQHGFITNRNCVTAAENHIGFAATISMDIADFFDNVTTTNIEAFSSEMASDTYFYHEEGYCSQGFATSPILCNIALIPALSHINEYLMANFDDYAFTVYADDIAISINHNNYNEINDTISAVNVIMVQHEFKLKHSKTRVRYAKHGFRRILGVMVGETGMKVPRKIKYKLRAAKFQQNGPSIGGLTTWSKLEIPKALR